MDEKIPFDNGGTADGMVDNDPMALLVMHKAWREIFDGEDTDSTFEFDFDNEGE